MKKLLALFLGLIISLNISVIYAGTGDPLYEHPEYVAMIRKHFEKAKSINSTAYAWKWEKKFEWKMFSSDYRTIRVYNIPYLVRFRDKKDGFLITYAKALLQAKKIGVTASKLSEKSKEKFIEYFSKEISDYIKRNGLGENLKDFLGAENEDVAIKSFIASLILSASAKVLGAITATSCVAMNAYNFLLPFLPAVAVAAPPVAIAITVVHNLVNIARIFTTSKTFAEERIANYALVLSHINRAFLNDTETENILNSNVLITAVDERNFYSLPVWNSFPGRRNDEGWAHFANIEGLACSPIAKDYESGDVIKAYQDIFREISCNESLDLDKMEKYIEQFGK